MRNRTLKTLALAIGISLAAVAISASAHAGSLRQGSTGSSSEVIGSLPGQVLWTYYQTFDSDYGEGDSILRLINPNGAANGNLADAKTQTVCAMLYVFDEDQEMGECCGCPLTSAQLATFSADKNLTSNWGLRLISEEFAASNAYGSLAIVAAAPNAPACLHQSGACNGGCDPTNTPGYSVTTAANLLGSITHNQTLGLADVLIPIGVKDDEVVAQPTTAIIFASEITETPLSDDAGGDPTNLIYLQNQCGAIVGNGTEGGICNCPTEG
jgi:hypothetical protein